MGKETYLRSTEAARYIGVCFRTMQSYISQGLIPCTKPAGRWLFRKSDLDAFLANDR
jgi:excisionase family DNA binding protein